MKKALLFAMIFACYHVMAQHSITIGMLDDEYWWGGCLWCAHALYTTG
jgi:hypothetical protein